MMSDSNLHHPTNRNRRQLPCIPVNEWIKALVDPGGAASACPPNRIHFFCFRIRFCRKVYASEVGAPPPQREILDPPLDKGIYYFLIRHTTASTNEIT